MAAAREAMEAAGADFSEIDDFIATAPLDDVKSFNSLVTNFGRKINGKWLPERRARYNSKRREKDLDLIFSVWNRLPLKATENKINIANIPSKVAKKYRRAAIHAYDWSRKDEIYQDEYAKNPSGDRMVAHSTEMLNLMQKHLPTHNSKVIVDVPQNFREKYVDGTIYDIISPSSQERWDDAEQNGATIYRYWMNYRIGNVKLDGDAQSGLEYIDEALSLLPPLRKGEMPHRNEVLARIWRPIALEKLGDLSGALSERRICLAAVRLLDYHGKVDLNDADDILIRKTDGLTSQILKLELEIKIQRGTTRPIFSHNERLDLMKELGFGMYSDDGLKCACCGKTDLDLAKLNKTLVLCAKCKGVWYCGRECQKKSWKGGHRKSCGRPRLKGPLKLPPILLEGLERYGFCLAGDALNSKIFIFCKDKSGEVFDALTDEVYRLGDWETPTYEEAADHSMACMHQMFKDSQLHSAGGTKK